METPYFISEFQLTYSIYAEFRKKVFEKKLRIQNIVGILSVTLTAIIFVMTLLMELNLQEDLSFSVFLCGAMFFLCTFLWILQICNPRIYYRQMEKAQGIASSSVPCTVSFGDSKITDALPNGIQSQYPYDLIEKVVVSENLYLLILKNQGKGKIVRAIIVPIDSLSVPEDSAGQTVNGRPLTPAAFPDFLRLKCPGILIQ